MTDDSRNSLAPLAGLPVTVDAAIARWGSAFLQGKTIYSLMLTDLRIAEQPRPEIDHLWLRLGVTGSQRVKKHLPTLEEMRCTLKAVVTPYERENGLSSHGIALASDVFLVGPRRSYLLNRQPEVVHGEEHGGKEMRAIHNALYRRSHEAQRDLMIALSAHRLPRHLTRAVQRFHRGELATPGEVREARRFLEEVCK